MSMKKDPSIPANDPDQFVVNPVENHATYLGNADVVHAFIGGFADAVLASYDAFRRGNIKADDAQSNVEALIKKYADDFMGRGAYQIAPWQGKRMTGKLLAAIPAMKGDDDPGEAFFRHLSLQCIKAGMALADGQDGDIVGARLREILDDARGRLLGVVV